MSDRRKLIYDIIGAVVHESADSNEAVATLLSCAHAILITAGNTNVEALQGLHDTIDECAEALRERGLLETEVDTARDRIEKAVLS